MLFLDYEKFKISYHAIQTQYNDILSEKEELFSATQPRSVRYDREKVSGGVHDDSFARYLIKKEQLKLDERLAEVERLLDARAKLMESKLNELKTSKDTLDRVYWYRFILGLKVKEIAQILNYSEPQIYKYVQKIKGILSDAYYELRS